jgi:hypothetical protein
MDRSAREQKAVSALQDIGAQIEIDEQSPGRPVIGVFLSESDVTDGGLIHIRDFPSLVKLDLNLTAITDRGLVHLQGLTTLRELFLHNTQVRDRGLAYLRGLE